MRRYIDAGKLRIQSLPLNTGRPRGPVVLVACNLEIVGPAVAQDNEAQQPSAREQLQQIHTSQSIDQELTRLTKDLELTREQQKNVRPLLQEHHDRIRAPLDKNPKASRQQLGPQIHAISDDTHRQIHALLTNNKKELEKAMQRREHNSEENSQPASPAAAPPKPFFLRS